jgi:hypothetical protein
MTPCCDPPEVALQTAGRRVQVDAGHGHYGHSSNQHIRHGVYLLISVISGGLVPEHPQLPRQHPAPPTFGLPLSVVVRRDPTWSVGLVSVP